MAKEPIPRSSSVSICAPSVAPPPLGGLGALARAHLRHDHPEACTGSSRTFGAIGPARSGSLPCANRGRSCAPRADESSQRLADGFRSAHFLGQFRAGFAEELDGGGVVP